ncbi:MAG: hypothetical protein QOI51_1617 [Nocardioidaceae bacterium]|nr:hypothetical protein [Nocardioidaceae bacterium]
MKEFPPPPGHDAQTAFLLTQVGSQFAGSFAGLVSELGLNPPHAGLLRAIAFGPGRSQQEISAQLGLLPSRLVALVDDLEGKGLVKRTRNPTDRRLHALTITPAGAEMMHDIGRIASANGAEMLKPLSRPERRVLRDLLTRLADHHGLASGVHPGYRSMGREDSTVGRPGTVSAAD